MQQSQLRRCFSSKHKLYVHVFQLILVTAVMTLAGVRLIIRTRSAPVTRTDSMALGIGAKSLIVIQYQMLSEHVRWFKKWASKKANLILNCLEILFWAAVTFLTIQAQTTRSCAGERCTLNWAVMALSIVLSIVTTYMAGISCFEFRESRDRPRRRQGLDDQSDMDISAGISLKAASSHGPAATPRGMV